MRVASVLSFLDVFIMFSVQHRDDQHALPTVPWRRCALCAEEHFKSPKDFCHHLRLHHCRKEGGSFVCTYGQNRVCKHLPLQGVHERDYETHVNRYHVAPNMLGSSYPSTSTATSSSTTATSVATSGASSGVCSEKPLSDSESLPTRHFNKTHTRSGSGGMLPGARPSSTSPTSYQKTLESESVKLGK